MLLKCSKLIVFDQMRKSEKAFSFHYVKSVCILSCFGLHFLAFGLDMERYQVSLRI